MKRRDREIGRALDRLPTPPHRPGFWDDLEDDLRRTGEETVSPAAGAGETIARLETSPRRPSPWAAAATAAVVVLVLGVGSALLLGPTGEGPGDATIPLAGAGGDAVGGTPAVVEGDPPWSVEPLRPGEAPRALAPEWRGSENRRWCSALIPGHLGIGADEASPRAAVFDGGWGIAWDRPRGPGQRVDGTDCPDCGRSAFGVAGKGEVVGPDIGARRPVQFTWDDGSRGGYGGEGMQATPQRQTAELAVEDQGCVYEVWSNLGEAHLVMLVNALRRVDGLEASPVELRTADDEPAVTPAGVAPWSRPAVTAGTVDPLIVEQAVAVGVDTPLVPTDLAVDGEIRSRTWESGVAWDAPDGPGHDGRNRPCADCGRGVIGIGWVPPVAPSEGTVSPPYRIEWDDGSHAEYGGRTTDPALPLDRVIFVDDETGERAPGAYQALIRVAGSDHDVVVWSHLGENHLRRLLESLRLVAAG